MSRELYSRIELWHEVPLRLSLPWASIPSQTRRKSLLTSQIFYEKFSHDAECGLISIDWDVFLHLFHSPMKVKSATASIVFISIQDMILQAENDPGACRWAARGLVKWIYKLVSSRSSETTPRR
jgi:hypothetical protein